jgi:hypothetical protein
VRRIAVLLVLSGVVALHARGQTPARSLPDASTPAVIRGRIVAADTDSPVRKSVVTLTADTSAGLAGDPIYSGDDGRFEFTAVAPGRYAISAWKSGYAPALFGARSSFEPAVHIAVRAGDVVSGVQIPLQRGAAISGRVTDDLGDPVIGISVSVSRVAVVSGRVRFGRGATAVDTDDLGEYRVGALAAGTYLVRASGFIPMMREGYGVDGGLISGFAGRQETSTFYPEGSRAAQAKPIVLGAGEEADGIDMTLVSQASRIATVSGRIVDPQGRSVDGYLLSTSTSIGGDPESVVNTTRGVPASGEFSIPLGPGDYVLSVRGAGVIAVQAVSVYDNDVSGIQLTLAAGAQIRGRVVFEGTAAHRSGVIVSAIPPNDEIRPALEMPSAAVSSSGAFTLSSSVGPREIRVARLPPGWIVKSITSGGRNIADAPIDLKSGDDLHDVVIILSDQNTELTGTVLDDRQRPAAGVSVIVFAEDRRQLSRRAQWVRPDTTGHFVIRGLPPGDYLAVTAVDVDDIGWQTPDYLDPLRSQAVRVRLTPSVKATLDLKWSASR